MFKGPSWLWSQNQSFSGLSAISSLSDSPQVDQNSVLSFYLFLLCEEIQTFLGFFFFLTNRQGSGRRACERTSSRGSRAPTCGLPPAVDNWPRKIWARMLCLDGADLSHHFQWDSCHRETEHGTPIILASFIPQHTCWAHLLLRSLC